MYILEKAVKNMSAQKRSILGIPMLTYFFEQNCSKATSKRAGFVHLSVSCCHRARCAASCSFGWAQGRWRCLTGSQQTERICGLDFTSFLIRATFPVSLKRLVALLLNYTNLSFFLQRFLWVISIKIPLCSICIPNLVIISVLVCGSNLQSPQWAQGAKGPRSGSVEKSTCIHHFSVTHLI